MAREIVLKSDRSGKEIPKGTGARVRITFHDRSRTDRRADLTDEEVDELLGFAGEVETRPTRRGEMRIRL